MGRGHSSQGEVGPDGRSRVLQTQVLGRSGRHWKEFERTSERHCRVTFSPWGTEAPGKAEREGFLCIPGGGRG